MPIKARRFPNAVAAETSLWQRRRFESTDGKGSSDSGKPVSHYRHSIRMRTPSAGLVAEGECARLVVGRGRFGGCGWALVAELSDCSVAVVVPVGGERGVLCGGARVPYGGAPTCGQRRL